MNWTDQTVLITGVCGTVGRALLAKLSQSGVRQIVGVDNNESELFFDAKHYSGPAPAHFTIGDVRDTGRIRDLMEGIDIVLHSAALKHVGLCEDSPRDAIRTNILGIENVIDGACAAGVSRVIFTSSDKAVNPTSVMGTSKLMGERLITAANMRNSDQTILGSTRFGNVLNSRGSVLPIFRQQILNGGPITLTDSRMTRFVMTMEQAANLVLDSALMMMGGEVFVTKMPIARIVDLAEIMIEELAPLAGRDSGEIEIEEIGIQPGEKLFEELLNAEETRRTSELENYFVIQPAFDPEMSARQYGGMVANPPIGVTHPYRSDVDAAMEKEELRDYLRKNELLGDL